MVILDISKNGFDNVQSFDARYDMFHSNPSSGNNTIDHLIAKAQSFTLGFFLRLMSIYFRNGKALEPRILIKITPSRNPNLLLIGYSFIMLFALMGWAQILNLLI
jgi:hypothetical protein